MSISHFFLLLLYDLYPQQHLIQPTYLLQPFIFHYLPKIMMSFPPLHHKIVHLSLNLNHSLRYPQFLLTRIVNQNQLQKLHEQIINKRKRYSQLLHNNRFQQLFNPQFLVHSKESKLLKSNALIIYTHFSTTFLYHHFKKIYHLESY